MMVEDGRQPVIHTVVTGGPAMLDTVKGLTSLLADFPPSVRLVVWLNEFFGPIVNAQGKPFEDMPAYTDNKDRIFAVVRLPMVSEEASSDLRDMIAKRLTFDQALARENTSILRVQKSRLFSFKEAVWPAIERVICEPARLRRRCASRASTSTRAILSWRSAPSASSPWRIP